MYRSLLLGGWDLPIPGRIPSDLKTLMVLSDCPDEDTWAKHGKTVLEMFDLSKDGSYYTNQRQQEELSKWRERRKGYVERGRLGGKAKKENHLTIKQDSSLATDQPSQATEEPSNQVKSSQAKSSQAKKEHKDSSAEASPAHEPAITMPLNTGDEFPVTLGQVSEWSKLYPAVDVMQQLRAMRGWCLAHQVRRKTKQGVNRFMNAWLAREQDKGGRDKSGSNGSGNYKSTDANRNANNVEALVRSGSGERI